MYAHQCVDRQNWGRVGQLYVCGHLAVGVVVCMDFTTGQDASVDDGQKGSRVSSSDNFEVTPRGTILCGYDANSNTHVSRVVLLPLLNWQKERN